MPRLLLPILALLATTPALAAGSLVLLDEPPAAATWLGGVTARSWPSAPGSVERSNGLLPAFDYTSPQGAFVSTDTGVGWNLGPLLLSPEQAKEWQFGARLWPQFGRPKRLTPQGVDRLGSRVTTEAFANWQVLPALLLQSGFSWGSGRRHNGSQLELGATTGFPIGKDDLIGIGVAASYANAAHLRSLYGVGPNESAASGLPVWRPGSGLQDVSLAISAEHKFSADWSISGQWLNARLMDTAAHSPLTQARSQQSFTLSLWRRF